jgi:hypothetical protein
VLHIVRYSFVLECLSLSLSLSPSPSLSLDLQKGAALCLNGSMAVSGQNGFNSNSEAKGYCAQTYDGQESTPCPETVATSEDRGMSMCRAKTQINL